MRHFVRLLFATLAASLMLVAIVGAAVADPIEEAKVAHDRGDYATALRLLRPLADLGLADAQCNLGFMYSKGEGVPQDYAEAAKWFRKAAYQGYAAAQFNLGFMYKQGLGVPQDYANALKWYRLAADQDDADAQSNLGLMYYEGLGVPQDYVQAHMWFNLSAARGSDFAKKNRDIITRQMTSAQIAEAQKLAREWKPKPER